MATILMIEDDGNFVRMVEKILSGHTVVHAASAMGGLALLDHTEVDLVLLDMDLPDLDGKVVATVLRARPGMATVPIIAVTAQSDGIARRLALGFGCTDFIPKPIDTRAFPEKIASFLVKNT